MTARRPSARRVLTVAGTLLILAVLWVFALVSAYAWAYVGVGK